MITIVDFYADWCGPCKMIAPVLTSLEEEGIISLRKVDIETEEGRQEALRADVKSIPTLVFELEGDEVFRHIGTASRGQLEKKVKELLA